MNVIDQRMESTCTVAAAGRRWAAPTARAIAELLTPELREGETLPDVAFLQELTVRALERRWRGLEAAAESCVLREADHRRLLDERADGTRELAERWRDVRDFLRSVFGADVGRKLTGTTGETPRDPVVLLRLGDRVQARLLDPSIPLPPVAFETPGGRPAPDEARTDGSGDDARVRAGWARHVAHAARALRSILARVALAGHELEAARLERRRRLRAFNDGFVGLAGWLEALYRLAGRDRWADVVRPSRRRKGLLHKDVGRHAATASKRRTGAVEKIGGEAGKAWSRGPVRRVLRFLAGRRSTAETSTRGPRRSQAL